ncbi:MAG TPA: winged helix DNA-binding protein [Novosphingobium sp.]|nr:winged helix DNA-binding protein [Novosphingobium sp.]HZV10659.1 winged helix DNA-binding protein [Novosphingobium sp.]
MTQEIASSYTSTEVATQLLGITQSLDVLASQLHSIAGQNRPVLKQASARRELPPSAEQLAKIAGQAYRDRRRRTELFGDETLFGEPAWDILLDLFVAAIKHKRVAVTSACIGSAVPTTTALRWLKILEEKGLILREEDPDDARRTFLRLSPGAYDLMVDYFHPEQK